MAVLGTLTGGGGAGDTPSGTKVTFAQTVAPTGWVKDVTHHDKAIRVVSGTASNGGAQSFTSVFGAGKSTDSHTLSTPQIPSHGHSSVGSLSGTPNWGNGPNPTRNQTLWKWQGNKNVSSQATGGSQGHSHSLSLDIQYVDVIIATKE